MMLTFILVTFMGNEQLYILLGYRLFIICIVVNVNAEHACTGPGLFFTLNQWPWPPLLGLKCTAAQVVVVIVHI